MTLGTTQRPVGNDPADKLLAGVPAAATDTGCERELNEDRYAVVESSSGTAWIVCDGVGGVAGGELAAHVAIEAMKRDLESMPHRAPEVALRSAILEANRVIVLRRQNPAFATMGTTIVASLIQGEEIAIAHVGDSRAYLLTSHGIKQLTTDHTLVQEMVDRGQIRAEDALSHPQAHVLTRALGAEPSVRIDGKRLWLETNPASERSDSLLLCSDGLYSLVRDDEIGAIASGQSPQSACSELVSLARARGGYDNITIAIVPLGGRVLFEPPAGYHDRQAERARRALEESAEEPIDFIKLGAAVLMLTLIAVAATIFISLYFAVK